MRRYWWILALVLVSVVGCGGYGPHGSERAFDAAILLSFDSEAVDTDEEVAALVDLVLREGSSSDAREALNCPRLTPEQRHSLIEVIAGQPIDVDAEAIAKEGEVSP